MKGQYYLYKSAVVASLAGFLFGFDTVVISGAEQTIQSLWKLDSTLHGLAISMALWGTVLGALTGGWPSERVGRKKTLLWIGALYLSSAIGSALAPEVYSFMFFRFIGGVGVGISTVAAPMFISEIAPPGYRGRLTGMFQFNIVFGILVAFVSNSFLGGVGENAWRWMLGVEAFPALLFSVLCFGLPESPRWLIVRKKDLEGGMNVLKQINPEMRAEALRALSDEILSSDKTHAQSNTLFSRQLLRPVLFLAQAFNVQLSWENILAIIGILFVTSKGAAGVTGSGFVVLASTLTAVRIIPVEGLALLLGVDRFMSEARAITNFIGNGVAAVWLANNEKEFDAGKMEKAFGIKKAKPPKVSDTIA